jgi:NAD(P)-dependent dehydrogenase (short-subunit alcohol dehydrogenase family)
VVADLSRSHGESTVGTIRRLGGEAIFAETDVASESQVQAMVQDARKAFDRIDFLVNNAAVLMSYARFELMRCRMTSGIARSMSTSKVIGCVRSM